MNQPVLLHPLGINPNRAMHNLHDMPMHINPQMTHLGALMRTLSSSHTNPAHAGPIPRRGLIPTHPHTTAREMSRIRVRLEAHQARAEHPIEDLSALR